MAFELPLSDTGQRKVSIDPSVECWVTSSDRLSMADMKLYFVCTHPQNALLGTCSPWLTWCSCPTPQCFSSLHLQHQQGTAELTSSFTLLAMGLNQRMLEMVMGLLQLYVQILIRVRKGWKDS